MIPLINSAVQKWAELKGKRVNYVMKGSNCLTEMYSALSAAVPLESDPATYADNELIESLFAVDRVMVCGQSLSHSVNYTVRDMLRLFSLYQEEFLSKDDPKAQIPVGNKIFLMKDGCSSHRGFENQSSEFNSFIKNAGVTSLKIQDLQAELSMNDEE